VKEKKMTTILFAQVTGVIFFLLALATYLSMPTYSLELFKIPGWAFFESIFVFVAGVAFTYLSIFVTGWEYIWMAVICWSIFAISVLGIWYVNRKTVSLNSDEEKE
jgi:hypothetical protein